MIVRIRPEFSPVTDGVIVQQDDTTVVLLPKPYDGTDAMSSKRARETAAKGFKLDRVFGPRATQLEVYRVAQPLALSVTAGYNATIFAYGHTGSGKTHT